MLDKLPEIRPFSSIGLTLSAATLAITTGCTQNFEIDPPAGKYDSAQSVAITIPSDATNVYMTTDAQAITNPTANCALSTGSTTLMIDKPTMVNITFDQNGDTYNQSFVYNITDNPINSGLTNTDVLNAWEFLNQSVIQNFAQADFTVSDALGIGTVTSVYDEFCCFYAEQSFTFSNYTYLYDGQTISIDSGTVAGHSPLSGSGSYGTYQQNGQPLAFSGDFNGSAEGQFQTNRENSVITTLSGFYRISCTDAGCSAGDIVYTFVSEGVFAELAGMETPGAISCN